MILHIFADTEKITGSKQNGHRRPAGEYLGDLLRLCQHHGRSDPAGCSGKKDKSFETVDLPDPDGLASEFWKLVNDTRKASVNILTRRDIAVRRSEGRRIVAITVPRADRRDRPVYVNGDPYMGTYRRDGEGIITALGKRCRP